MTQIRAKMQVQSVTATEYSDEVALHCVKGNGDAVEDNAFARYTPSGSLKLQIDNPSCRGFFKPGAKVYVDISIAEEPKPKS